MQLSPSIDALNELLDVIGLEYFDDVVDEEAGHIMKSDYFYETAAAFLFEVGKSDLAEAYILKNANCIDGNYYNGLLSLAKIAEKANRYLAVILIYRSLLVSILGRGYTKAYPHGVRYLKKLDKLTIKISNWRNFADHKSFKESIIQAHGRKSSFWAQYED